MAFLRRWGGAAAAAACAVLLLVRPLAAQPSQPPQPTPPPPSLDVTVEDDVKAAYLFNFTKFVHWPTSAFTGQTDPLNICVAGDTAVVRAVERIVSGEYVGGRPIRAITQLPDVPGGCHVLFVGRGASERAARLMGAATSSPMLTVGESPRFLQQGGMIAFIVEHRRVRFDISMPAAERAGLKLSSKLLRVARRVDEGSQLR